MGIMLSMGGDLFDALHTHLLRPHEKRPVEQVAFLFSEPYAGDRALRLSTMHPVPPEDFLVQTDYHVDLAEHVRPDMIKRAWDLDGCLVEAHTHDHHGEVYFSSSDVTGFEDWVPHLWWRLKGRPYAALVFGYESFDGLCWVDGPDRPEQISRLSIDGRDAIRPTNRTLDPPSRHRRGTD